MGVLMGCFFKAGLVACSRPSPTTEYECLRNLSTSKQHSQPQSGRQPSSHPTNHTCTKPPPTQPTSQHDQATKQAATKQPSKQARNQPSEKKRSSLPRKLTQSRVPRRSVCLQNITWQQPFVASFSKTLPLKMAASLVPEQHPKPMDLCS